MKIAGLSGGLEHVQGPGGVHLVGGSGFGNRTRYRRSRRQVHDRVDSRYGLLKQAGVEDGAFDEVDPRHEI